MGHREDVPIPDYGCPLCPERADAVPALLEIPAGNEAQVRVIPHFHPLYGIEGEAGRVVHRDVLHGRQRFTPGQTDIAHVADIEYSDAGAHGQVLIDDAATYRRGVFDRHIPTVELDHLRAHLAMDGIQRGFADFVAGYGGGFDYGQGKPRLHISRTVAGPSEAGTV